MFKTAWQVREDLIREAKAHIDARERFERNHLDGKKSTKPLTMTVDARDLLRALENGEA